MDTHPAASENKTVTVELRSLGKNPTDWTHWTADLGIRNGAVVCEIFPAERESIEKLFWIVTLSLLGMIAASLAGTVLLLPMLHFRALLGMVAGFLGSGTAALRSALDRHARGIEDADGHQWPDPGTKKERFNRGMGTWFLYRPVLGTVVGFLVYLAADAGFLRPANSEKGLAFFALVGGLFAKSLLDLLLEKFKNLFGLTS